MAAAPFTIPAVRIDTLDDAGDVSQSHHLAVNQDGRGRGNVVFTAKMIRDLVGDPRDFPREEWQHRDYRHGVALPLGWINASPPPLSNYQALRMTRADLDAYAAACQPVEGYLPAFEPFKRRKASKAPVEPAQRVSTPAAPSAPAEAPIALPVAAAAPLEASASVMDRLARLEALLGVAAPAAKRTEKHAAAIRRAWAMRALARRTVAQRQAWFDRAKDAEMRLRDMETARDEVVADMERIEAARAAAVRRAQCDEARAIDAETSVALMTQERDDALALASAEETAARGAQRALTAASAQVRRVEARAERLQRVAFSSRTAARRADDEARRVRADLTISKACERQALRKLADLREAIDASPTAAKVIERNMREAA